MDRGAWLATVRGVTKSWTRPNDEHVPSIVLRIDWQFKDGDSLRIHSWQGKRDTQSNTVTKAMLDVCTGAREHKEEMVVVLSLSSIQLLATPWTAACQTWLSFTVTWSLLTVMSTELVMPSNHPLSPPLGEPLLFSFSLGLGFITAMSNSMKLWVRPCRATQDRWVMVESSDTMWSTGGGNGKPIQYSCLENPMNRMKRQKDRTLKDELPRSVGAQYATGDEWRNNSRNNEETEPTQKQHPVVDVTDDGSKSNAVKNNIV